MPEPVTAARMRAIESAAIASGAVTGLALMERAGAGAVAAVLAAWPALAAGPRRAAVLCGPGNNGGDGFVIARLLRERGWDVEVFLFGDPARLPPDARAAHDAWAALGPVRPLADLEAACRATAGADRPDLWVDALFGTGLARAVPAEVGRALEAAGRAAAADGGRVVAVDVPSGVDADTGRAMFAPRPDPGPPYRPLQADLTVTFHAAKPCHAAGEGRAFCGRVVVADIGLEPWDGHRHDA